MGDEFLAKQTVETVFDNLDLDGSGKVEFSGKRLAAGWLTRCCLADFERNLNVTLSGCD